MRHGSVRPIVLSGLLSALALTSCGGGDGGEGATEPVLPLNQIATTIRITPGALNFTQVCQSEVLSWEVLDQEGNPFMSPVTWSTSDGNVAPVSGAGKVTAGVPGGAVIEAQSGDARASVPVTVEGGAEGPFNLQVGFIHCPVVPTQTAAFVRAAARWNSAITGDLDDVDFGEETLTCGGSLLLPGFVDDLKIYIRIEDIDGPGGIIGGANPCTVREGDGLTVIGSMRFDRADLVALDTTGLLERVVAHEMGHVLGIGTLWASKHPIVNPSIPGMAGADSHFTGSFAVAAFDAAGGVNYTGGGKVPVANSGERGSADGHWREDVLGNELMTPILDPGVVHPLSAISIQSLADLGYTVDVSTADPYNRDFTVTGLALESRGEGVRLENDVSRGPIAVVDERGRILRVINP